MAATAENPSNAPTPKAIATAKIIEVLSTELAPTADGNYTKTITHILQVAYSDPTKQQTFKSKLAEWELRLQKLGHKPQPEEPILFHVPAGAAKEFYVSPWQLSFDPDVSVKGLPHSPPVTWWCNT